MISDSYRFVLSLPVLFCSRFIAPIALIALIAVGSLTLLAGCQPSEPQSIQELSGPTMGTQWLISLGANNTGSLSLDSLQTAVETELRVINELMSTWDPNSELSRFNAAQSIQAIALDAHTMAVLETAQRVSDATNGAYDVTRGNVFALWGFSADEPKAYAPSKSELDTALNQSGWQSLQIETASVAKPFPSLTIDLSSLAKGYAVDRLGQLLQDNKIDHYVVNIGGEIESRGERSENTPWRIGIELPDENRSAETGLLVNDINIATSGSYRNVRFVDGKRVSHIIDGRTGMPISHDLVASTVVHQSTMLADAWSTAFMVTGAQWAKTYAIAHDLAVQLTQLDGAENFTLWQSPKWQELQVISAD